MDLYVHMCAHVYCVTCNVQCAPDRFCATRGCGELLGSRLTFLDNWNGFPNARRLSISQFTIFHLTFHWVFHNISHFNHNLTLCLLSHLSQWCTTTSFADKAEDKWIDMKWHILQKNPRMLAFYKVLAWLQNFEIFHPTLSLHRTCWCTDKLDLFSDKTCHCIYRGQIVVRFDLKREISRYFRLNDATNYSPNLQSATNFKLWQENESGFGKLPQKCICWRYQWDNVQGICTKYCKILQNIAKYQKMLQNTTKYCKMPQIIAQILGEIALRCICRRY